MAAKVNPLALDNVKDGAMSEEEQKKRLRAKFDVIDADGSGRIDSEELKMIMEQMGHEVTDAQVATLMAQADTDGNGTIEFDEFCALYGQYDEAAKEFSDEKILAEAFKVFDVDGNGYLDKEEIAHVMRRLKTDSFREPDPAFVDLLIKEADVDGDVRVCSTLAHAHALARAACVRPSACDSLMPCAHRFIRRVVSTTKSLRSAC